MYDLLEEAAAFGNRPRFVYASSIAVLRDPLPAFDFATENGTGPGNVVPIEAARRDEIAVQFQHGQRTGA